MQFWEASATIPGIARGTDGSGTPPRGLFAGAAQLEVTANDVLGWAAALAAPSLEMWQNKRLS